MIFKQANFKKLPELIKAKNDAFVPIKKKPKPKKRDPKKGPKN